MYVSHCICDTGFSYFGANKKMTRYTVLKNHFDPNSLPFAQRDAKVRASHTRQKVIMAKEM